MINSKWVYNNRNDRPFPIEIPHPHAHLWEIVVDYLQYAMSVPKQL